MSGGALINSISINIRIEKIKKSLLQNYTKEKNDMIKILYLLSTPKIALYNNGCFEKHYPTCRFISEIAYKSDNVCTCINMDFIVEHLMIYSEQLI